MDCDSDEGIKVGDWYLSLGRVLSSSSSSRGRNRREERRRRRRREMMRSLHTSRCFPVRTVCCSTFRSAGSIRLFGSFVFVVAR